MGHALSAPQSALRRQGGGAASFTLGWLFVLGLVYWFFHAGYPQWSPFAAQAPQVTATGEVVLKRNRAGHFVSAGAINGVPVRFLVDTGATQIAVPLELARRLDLRLGAPVAVQTAAGPSRGYLTRLESVEVGSIEASNLSAIVAEGLHPDLVLLGMNFLRRIEMVLRGDELILRPAQTHQAALPPLAARFPMEAERSSR
jgi:aspartyl protease family protein